MAVQAKLETNAQLKIRVATLESQRETLKEKVEVVAPEDKVNMMIQMQVLDQDIEAVKDQMIIVAKQYKERWMQLQAKMDGEHVTKLAHIKDTKASLFQK